MTISKAVIIDLDGTIADCEHRVHYVQNGNKNWGAFFREIPNDILKLDVLNAITSIVERDYYPIFVTGRPEETREVTMDWLKREGVIAHLNAASFEEIDEENLILLMRKQGDYRKDTIIKNEIYDEIVQMGFNPEYAYDDRLDICEVWRKRGVCAFQVSAFDGNYHKSKISPAKKPNLFIPIGPSGSGKSSYWKNSLKDKGVVKVSTDQMRAMINDDEYSQENGDQIFAAWHRIIKAHLESGIDVYADATNLRRANRMRLLDEVLENVDADVTYILMGSGRKGLGHLEADGNLTEKSAVPDFIIKKHQQQYESGEKHFRNKDNDPRVNFVIKA